VEEEDTQNKELLELSRQILSLTKEVRALTAGGAAGTRPAGTHAGLHTLRRRCGGLRRASLRWHVCEKRTFGEGRASSSTAPPDPRERLGYSSPGTSAPTSPQSATRRTSG
jgi:hypothetical protein